MTSVVKLIHLFEISQLRASGSLARSSSYEPDEADASIKTVGGYLDIYSALPPRQLPRDIDIRHLEEVSQLAEAIRVFTLENDLTFEFELDRDFVGSIECGKIDRSLGEGLLDEWKRYLGASSS